MSEAWRTVWDRLGVVEDVADGKVWGLDLSLSDVDEEDPRLAGWVVDDHV